jgi:5-methylcytosine-specific restriction endonuclease McrA
MALTPKQERFIQEYRVFAKSQIGKFPTIEGVAKGLVNLYITCKSESDKEYTAWLIARIKPEIKLIGIEEVIDMDELWRLAKSKQIKVNRVSKIGQKRRHQKREDFALTDKEWDETILYFNYSCAYCGNDDKLTYDHVIPFSKGGSFTKQNIIPACKHCNSSKNDNEIKEWYRKQNFYSEEREKAILEFLKLM